MHFSNHNIVESKNKCFTPPNKNNEPIPVHLVMRLNGDIGLLQSSVVHIARRQQYHERNDFPPLLCAFPSAMPSNAAELLTTLTILYKTTSILGEKV